MFSLFARTDWGNVVAWWRAQYHRCLSDDRQAINQNKYDVIKNEELRQRIAPFLQQLFPDESTCSHCQWPWGLVQQHSVMVGPSRGVFVLCEYCWRHLRSYGRDEVIRRLHHECREKHWPDMNQAVLDAALDQEFGPTNFVFHAQHPDQE
jgi:hypothetical protein